MSQSTPSVQHSHLVKVIEKLALRFFTLFLLIFSFLLFYFGPLIAPAYKEVFVSFSTSLFASLVFAQFYNFLVEQHRQRVVNAEVAQSIELAHHSIVLQAKTTEQELMDFLKQLGCDPAIVPALREEAQAFREAFFAQLGWQVEP